MRLLLLTLAVGLLGVSQSHAQTRGPRISIGVGPAFGFGSPYGFGPGSGFGYGPGFGYGGYPYYGNFGYFPNRVGSFWSNGMSLYGPPVPTFGPVPGVFGGGDQRFYANPNPWPFRGNGVGVGIYPNSPRPQKSPHHTPYEWENETPLFAPPRVPVARALPELDATELDAPNNTPQSPAPVIVEVLVDTDAILVINDKDTKTKGAERYFQSPPVDAGKTFSYEIEATWTNQGIPMRQRRTIILRAGDRATVDLTKPDLQDSILPPPTKVQ